MRDKIRFWLRYELRYRVGKRVEGAQFRLARRLPRWLRYRTWLAVAADATTDPELSGVAVPEVPLDDLLRVVHRQLAEPRRSRGHLERIARAAEDLWANRLGWSDGRRPYAPREQWAGLASALGHHDAAVELREAIELEEAAPAVRYPHADGDVLVLGPELFASRDGAVLSWRGENYVPQRVASEATDPHGEH